MPSDEDYKNMAEGRGNKVYDVCSECGLKFYTVDAKNYHKCWKKNLGNKTKLNE